MPHPGSHASTIVQFWSCTLGAEFDAALFAYEHVVCAAFALLALVLLGGALSNCLFFCHCCICWHLLLGSLSHTRFCRIFLCTGTNSVWTASGLHHFLAENLGTVMRLLANAFILWSKGSPVKESLGAGGSRRAPTVVHQSRRPGRGTARAINQ